MNELLLQQLVQKYLVEAINADELEQLRLLLAERDSEGILESQFRSLFDLQMKEVHMFPATDNRIQQYVMEHLKDAAPVPPVHRVHFLKTAWFRYAAAIILVLGTGAYLWFQYSRPQTFVSDHKRLPAEIAPGHEGAILTLADGTQVVLDSLGNGVIATQNGAQVVLQNGQLGYEARKNAYHDGRIYDAGAVSYNTMTTPKGRQFQVILPDGTKVWLNAASSIKYPTVFAGKERLVEVSGEAYFEVAKDKVKPFFVQLNDKATVEVLGTSFNVNAYKDEASINTTLIEGSIRASVVYSDRPKDPENAILKPGQQVQLMLVGQKTQPGIKVINNADIDKVMAWKNGAFNFNDASLEEVMRQLERWYDIEVVYEKGIPDIHFVGEMSRDVSLAGLLRTLEASKVHFRMEEGRRLVVFP